MSFYTQITDQQYSPTVQRILHDMMLRGEAVRNEPYHNYPGQRFANTTEDTKRSQEMIRRLIAQNPEYLDEAQGLTRRATTPFSGVAASYMNPYQQHVLDRMREEGGRTFKENIMPELANTFTRMGQHGSTRHAQLAERAARQVQQDIAAQQNASLSKHYGEAYNMYQNDQNRNLTAANTLNQIGLQRQLQGLSNAEALGNIGNQNQAENQRLRDWEFNNFMEQRNLPSERLREQAAIMQGLPYERRVGTRSHEQPAPQVVSNGAGALSQILGNLASMTRR